MDKSERMKKIKRNIVIGSIITAIIGCGLFTLIAKDSGKRSIEVSKAEKNEMTQKQEEQGTLKALTEIKAREPNTNNFSYITSEDGIKVPVPNGYVPSTDVEERYVNGVTTDGVREHHGGFVIYEKNVGETDEEATAAIAENLDTAQRTRNQWVWVPIEDVTDMYHTSGNLIYGNTYTFSASSYNKNTSNSIEPVLEANYDFDHTYLKIYMEGISKAEFMQEMRAEFVEMLKSVATYGGFYIGRYETGNTRNKNVGVVKGYTGTTSNENVNNQINDITWYDSYLKCRMLRGVNPVHTGLIWGIQWDVTMKYLVDSGEKTCSEVGSNSSGWGNYSNVTFTYMNANGEELTKKSGSYIIPTGSTEYTKANNIYDLAGNMFEWTMAFYNYVGRDRRGGFYGNSGNRIPASVHSVGGAGFGDNGTGCRATLYIS